MAKLVFLTLTYQQYNPLATVRKMSEQLTCYSHYKDQVYKREKFFKEHILSSTRDVFFVGFSVSLMMKWHRAGGDGDV